MESVRMSSFRMVPFRTGPLPVPYCAVVELCFALVLHGLDRYSLRSAHSHADIPSSCARILAAPCFARRAAELSFCFVSHHEDD